MKVYSHRASLPNGLFLDAAKQGSLFKSTAAASTAATECLHGTRVPACLCGISSVVQEDAQSFEEMTLRTSQQGSMKQERWGDFKEVDN